MAVMLDRTIKKSLVLMSDSSGNLLEHFFTAILTQFPKDKLHIQTIPFIKNRNTLTDALQTINPSVVFHAFADHELKTAIAAECDKRKLKCWDVTGPTVEYLEGATDLKASRTPQPLHIVDSAYLGRMGALEFAIQHDDSRRLDRLEDAEIIIVGISRVSKSPTALFLAYRGFRVANISIVPSQGFPDPLKKHRVKNVVALTLQPRRLSQIRKRRFAGWNLKEFNYDDQREIVHEVAEAESMFRKKKWPIINTTDLAVEESSTLVLTALKLKPKLL